MNQDPDDLRDPAQELRRQAEKRLQGTIIDERLLTDMSPDAIRSLVHELQTHHVELEMQNETLRQTEEALLASRDQFVELYDFSPVGYLTLAERGRIVGANLTSCALLGIDRSALLGTLFTKYIVDEDQDRYYQHSRDVLATRERQYCELRLKKADGNFFYGRLDSQATAQDPSFRMALSDISAHVELEQKIIHLERLHAIGELAAGISHNLNNMLTGVTIPAQLLLNKIEDPDLRSHLDDIVESGRRMTSIVQQVHHFVHQDKPTDLEEIDLNSAVVSAVKISRNRWQDAAQERGIAIEIITDLKAVPPIRATSSELESLLLNLLLNAVDALPEGGAITLQTQPVEGGAQLVIADTGIGMDIAVQGQIFEPFFTSKKTVGTGLGLSTVYRTMQNWNGHISVESTPGLGSAFTLNFSPQQKTAVSKIAVDKPKYPVAAGRILIVDDSELVVSILRRSLAKHQVESAQDGLMALSGFAEDRYDAVLIDLGLPKLAGDQVARSMRQIDRAVALVLISGFGLSAGDERLAHFDFYMQKPFGDLDAILSTVDQAIALRQQRKRE